MSRKNLGLAADLTCTQVSHINKGEKMADDPMMALPETDAIGELRKIVEQQKSVIVSLSAQVKGYEQRLNEVEKRAAAIPAAAGVPAAEAAPEENPQDAAYKAVLKEMGIDTE